MINPTTINKLHEMRLAAMAEAFYNQMEDETYKELSFEERVGIMVDREWPQAMDVLELIEARYQNASTIFCTQFSKKGWHEKIGEDTLADAILDRIVHGSHTIFIDGRISMRERNGLLGESKPGF